MTTAAHAVTPHRAVRTVLNPPAAPPAAAAAVPAPPADGRFAWLAPMVLWPLARRHMPRRAVRRQGGGTQRADDEATFAAIVYVLVSGVPWRALPKTFAVSWQNTHRRFTQWSEAGLWERIQHTSRAAQAPAAARQWADRMRALAEGRLSRQGGPAARAYTPEPGIRSVPADPLPRPPRARIRVHEPDGFTDRLFGVGLPARAAPRTAGDERAAS